MSSIVRKKIDASNLFNCNNIELFASSIVQVLPFKGYSNSLFYMCELHGVRFLTKLVFYHKTSVEMYGKSSPKVIPQADAEILILKLLRETIIEQGITPCILELVVEKVCTKISRLAPSASECEHLIIDYSITNFPGNIDQVFCKYNDLIKHGFAHDKCAFLVLEKCDMVFDEYIQKAVSSPVGLSVFKSLLFMVIHAIYSISKVYPGFRHYDLHTDNIMLKFDQKYKFKANEPKFMLFHIDDTTFTVPYFGILPKIIDFGFGVIPEEGIISNIVEDKYRMYHRSENDLLFLFYHIYSTALAHNNPRLRQIEKILGALEPNKTYKHYYTEYIRKVDKQIPTYESMINNKIFNEYKKYTIRPDQIHSEYMLPEELISRPKSKSKSK
jgi:hypothetical protein